MADSRTVGTLDGRVALATGRASGIGECCARLLAARGAVEVVADLNKDAAQEVADSVGGHAVTLDITDPGQLTAGVSEVETRVGRIDIAVLSAGIAQYPHPHPPEDFTMSGWDAIVDVHFRRAYMSDVAVGTPMSRRGHALLSLSGPSRGSGPCR